MVLLNDLENQRERPIPAPLPTARPIRTEISDAPPSPLCPHHHHHYRLRRGGVASSRVPRPPCQRKAGGMTLAAPDPTQ